MLLSQVKQKKTTSNTFRFLFEKLRQANLKLKRTKCDFFKDEIKCLGHVTTKTGILPDQDKVKATKELSPPKKLGTLEGLWE